MLSFCSHDLPHSLDLIKFIFEFVTLFLWFEKPILPLNFTTLFKVYKQTNKQATAWLAG
jgi:hypothetical protein